MERIMKVINIMLMVIVGMLLLISVMIFLQVSQSDLSKIKDWWAPLNAVATAGTFVVALIALLKAPNWFNQKTNEEGYSIANQIIYTDLPEIRILSNKFRVKFTAFCYNAFQSLNNEKVNESYTNSLIVDAETLINELTSANYSLIKKLGSLKRYKWYPNAKLNENLKLLNEIIKEINDLKSDSDIEMDKLLVTFMYVDRRNELTDDDRQLFKKSVQDIVGRCHELHRNTTSIISKITDSDHPITHFFVHPK